jgi:Fe-Mn family superoxide dismutase
MNNLNKLANQTSHPFVLPELPFANNALEPHMSAATFSYHHGKHHAAYVTNLNNLLNNGEFANQTLEQIIIASANVPDKSAIFNNAAQIWNHSFFWNCLTPSGGGLPKAKLLEKINQQFGDFDKFKQTFKDAGLTQFGSGWVWLVLDGSDLKIVKTANADLPLIRNQKPIITCDVWEHAYYVDYQNRRGDFLSIFLDHLVNWQFAEDNFNN